MIFKNRTWSNFARLVPGVKDWSMVIDCIGQALYIQAVRKVKAPESTPILGDCRMSSAAGNKWPFLLKKIIDFQDSSWFITWCYIVIGLFSLKTPMRTVLRSYLVSYYDFLPNRTVITVMNHCNSISKSDIIHFIFA